MHEHGSHNGSQPTMTPAASATTPTAPAVAAGGGRGVPRHVAIIMDGNGRWAKARGLSRSMGHQQGVETVREITTLASRLGIEFLTLYTFSTENWNRPADEVAALMSLIITAMEEELFMKNNVRMRTIGDIDRLPENVSAAIRGLEARTAGNTGMTMVIALSYSSRWELTRAARRLAEEAAAGRLDPATITEQSVTDHLATAFMPDPDLLIRTGGEVRLSNYLLWQCAYSELYFCDTFWPDFHAADFMKALDVYRHRERRYGKTSEQVQHDDAASSGQPTDKGEKTSAGAADAATGADKNTAGHTHGTAQ